MSWVFLILFYGVYIVVRDGFQFAGLFKPFVLCDLVSSLLKMACARIQSRTRAQTTAEYDEINDGIKVNICDTLKIMSNVWSTATIVLIPLSHSTANKKSCHETNEIINALILQYGKFPASILSPVSYQGPT